MIGRSSVTGDASVVICAYTLDRWSQLKEAVQSVIGQTAEWRELIVVIDHNDELLSRARSEWPRLSVLPNEGQKGLSGARNTGVQSATGQIVAFLDDDAIASPDWLSCLLDAYVDDRVIGVGGSIDPLWVEGRPRWFPEEYLWVVGCTYRGMAVHDGSVRNVLGANMSFRRVAFDEVGGFHCNVGRLGTIPLGCEETEFCIRAQQHLPHCRFVYEPRAQVYHRVPANRTTMGYFAARCFGEGISKARITQLIGADHGLSSERAYVLHCIPDAMRRALGQWVRPRKKPEARKAAALAVGLVAAGAGFVAETVSVRGVQLIRSASGTPRFAVRPS